jgi:acylphosphatase
LPIATFLPRQHAILSTGMADSRESARRWFVRGRVQGVGFRYFAQRAADGLGLRGYARNLDDGRVEVYAIGSVEQLDRLAGMLHTGPRWAEVHGVDEEEAEPRTLRSFEIR